MVTPFNASVTLHFENTTNNPVNNLITNKGVDELTDYFVGKDLIQKDQYEIEILVNDELIEYSRANSRYQLFVVQDEGSKEKVINVSVIILPYTTLITEYKNNFRFKCPKLLGDDKLHDILVVGDYAMEKINESINYRIFKTKEASYDNSTKLKTVSIPQNKFQYNRHIYIPQHIIEIN